MLLPRKIWNSQCRQQNERLERLNVMDFKLGQSRSPRKVQTEQRVETNSVQSVGYEEAGRRLSCECWTFKVYIPRRGLDSQERYSWMKIRRKCREFAAKGEKEQKSNVRIACSWKDIIWIVIWVGEEAIASCLGQRSWENKRKIQKSASK